jgi:AhpD family alkylhydroperoxidase
MDQNDLELMRDFSKHSHGVSAQIKKMRQDIIYRDGALSAKFKALAATLWSVSVRCEPCLEYYVQEAKKRGATEEEVAEAMALASVMGACVAETWGLKAYRAFKEGESHSGQGAEKDACCR